MNSLLAALPRKSCLRLLPGLVPVELAFGEVLYEPGEPIGEVYFPGGPSSRCSRWWRATSRWKSGWWAVQLAHMRGVRRVGSNRGRLGAAARKAHRVQRGNIRILDDSGLEAASCSCYRSVRDMHDVARAS